MTHAARHDSRQGAEGSRKDALRIPQNWWGAKADGQSPPATYLSRGKWGSDSLAKPARRGVIVVASDRARYQRAARGGPYRPANTGNVVSEAASRTEKVAALIAAISTAVAAGAFVYSVHVNNETNSRLTAEKNEEFVQHVSLQEAPQYACARHAECAKTGVQWVLVNFNAIQLVDVWVEGSASSSVKMFNIPACSMYALPVGFVPVAAHFDDPHGSWTVATRGAYTRSAQTFIKRDTDDSPWINDVANCP